MAINKVIYGGETLIDLTGDTVTADKILSGFTAHDKAGEPITGTCEFDVNSQDATAAVAEILQGKTAYVRGQNHGTAPCDCIIKAAHGRRQNIFLITWCLRRYKPFRKRQFLAV